jgi:hypothetical protein
MHQDIRGSTENIATKDESLIMLAVDYEVKMKNQHGMTTTSMYIQELISRLFQCQPQN